MKVNSCHIPPRSLTLRSRVVSSLRSLPPLITTRGTRDRREYRREPSGEGPGRNGGKETRNPPFIRHASLISFPSSRLGPGVARAGRNGVRDEPNVMKKRAGIDHSRRHTGPFTSVSAHPRLPLLTPFLRHSRSLRSPRMIETFMNDPFREVKVESSQGEGKGTVTDDQPLSHSSPIICSSLTVPHSFHLP